MFRCRVFLVLVALAGGVGARPVSAQNSEKDKICGQVENRALVPGSWASYKWIGGQSGNSTMRMAVVGTETRDGKPFYWFEVAIDDPARPNARMIVQMLTPGLGAKAADVRSLVLKTGNQPAMRMPPQTMAMVSANLGSNYIGQISRECQASDALGWEQITVPAGSFRAMHLRNGHNGVDVWVQPSLAFPLVKTTTKDGQDLVLTAQGTGAKSSITETPIEMPGLPGAPPR